MIYLYLHNLAPAAYYQKKGTFSMIESAIKLGEISLAIFESAFANKIGDFHDKASVISYFNEFDESMMEHIERQIKDQYEIEKLKDFISKNPLLSEQKYQFITEEAKVNFIDQFYKQHYDLKYIGSKRINHCLELYMDKLNVLLNNVLSTEGKILLQQINTSTASILGEIQDAKRGILDLKSTVLSSQNNKEISPSLTFYNITRKNKLFCGRNKIMDDIYVQLSNSKLIFLTGPGGIGKSQIAREVVSRSQNKYKLILWFSANSEAELLEEFNNAAIHYKLIHDKSNEFDMVLSALTLLIDNYPDSLIVYDGADDISINFLAAKCLFAKSDIIVTTQNSNIDPNEFPVIPVNVFDIEESKSFLINNTSKRQHTENDIERASALAILLENYPLALEYARAYVNKAHISFDEYFNIYEENKQDILNSTIISYKKTAYTAWKISFDKVIQQSPQAKDILNVVSLFDSHDIPIYDIFLFQNQYSSFEFSQIVSSITGYSLFTINDKLANTHGITQEFIRKQMNEDHVYQNYYEKTLQLLSELIPQKITNAFERDFVMQITKHAIRLISHKTDAKNKNIERFTANIISKLYFLGNYAEVIRLTQEQLELFDYSIENFSAYEMQIFVAQSYHYIGNDSAALNLLAKYISFTESSELLTDMQKWYLLSCYKNVVGIIQKDQGQLRTCIKTFLESLEFVENMGDYSDDEQKTNILNNIGNAYRNLSQLEDALNYYQLALQYSQNNKHHLLRIYGNIGLTHKSLNNYKLALKYFQSALDFSIELGDKRNECVGLEHMGNCYICLHDFEKAIPFLEKSLQIAQDINFLIGELNVYYDYGSLAFCQQKYNEARKYWQLSLEKSISINYQKGIKLSKYALSQFPK